MLQRITTTPTISLSCIRKADDPVFTKYPTWGFEVGEILRYSYYTIIEEFGLGANIEHIDLSKDKKWIKSHEIEIYGAHFTHRSFIAYLIYISLHLTKTNIDYLQMKRTKYLSQLPDGPRKDYLIKNMSSPDISDVLLGDMENINGGFSILLPDDFDAFVSWGIFEYEVIKRAFDNINMNELYREFLIPPIWSIKTNTPSRYVGLIENLDARFINDLFEGLFAIFGSFSFDYTENPDGSFSVKVSTGEKSLTFGIIKK